MGVIKKNENLFEVRNSVSEETLYLSSSDDDEYNYPPYEDERQRREPLRLVKQRPPPIGPSFSCLKNHSGKKKFRRYHNANQLISLAEEEELQEVTIEDFMANSKSPFSFLLENDEFLETWGDLTLNYEEKQREELETRERKKKEGEKQPVISKTLRNLLRRKNIPIELVNFLEQELISFFLAQPTKTYVSPALSSFERLLLHSVSNYHRLNSLSFVSEPQNIKLVRVKNPKNEFSSPPLPLVKYIESTYGSR